jgi:integral membrane protein
MSVQARPDRAGTRPRKPVSRALLVAYRVMAYVTAILLIPLVFVATPLDLIWHRPALAGALGFAHGMLYMVYVLVAFVTGLALRLSLVRIVLLLLAGTVPFAGFFAERYVTHAWQAANAAASANPPAAAPPAA